MSFAYQRVLQLLPCTISEAAEWLPCSVRIVSAQLHRLRALGLVRKTRRTVPGSSGRACGLWERIA
jgi:CRP-like cAMP-binding protein